MSNNSFNEILFKNKFKSIEIVRHSGLPLISALADYVIKRWVHAVSLLVCRWELMFAFLTNLRLK